MATAAQIKTYIDGLGSFPLNRTTSVFYGNTDAEVKPLMMVTDVSATYTWDTCGLQLSETKFQVHVLAESLTQADTLSSQVNALLERQAVTANTQLCYCERYEVITGPVYLFYVVRHYVLVENY